MVNNHSSNHCLPCFFAFNNKCISKIKTWPEKCPLVYSFHCLPHTSIFLYCQMNLFTLLLKLLWLWRQNQKLLEPSKSMKSNCLINLNMSYDIIFPEIWVTRLLHCQWCISFCMVWEPREGSRTADCLPMTTSKHFQLSPHLPDASYFGQLFSALDVPRKPAYLLFIDFGCHHGYYLLVSFLDGEPAVLLVWPRFWPPCLLILNMVPAHVLRITWQEQNPFFSSCVGCPGLCLP